MNPNLVRVIPTGTYSTLKRIQGFITLPRIFLEAVKDEACDKSKISIMGDLLYIFFKLKYYPTDYLKCRLWENDRESLVYFYGSPSSLYARIRLRKSVQSREYQILFDDKYLTLQYLKGLNVPLPKTFGLLEAKDFNKPYINDLLNRVNREELLVKPIEGNRGRGVFIIRRKNESIFIDEGGSEVNIDAFSLNDLSLVQEKVEQHKSISEIYPHSLNTIRLHTLYTHDADVLILGAYIRFGKGGNIVDNIGAGGIAVGIDYDLGKTSQVGYDNLAKKYYVHPDTKLNFCNLNIPDWEEILKIAQKVQKATFFYKLLGLDIAISKDGPVVIEINANPEMSYSELYTQPLLKDKKILEEFSKYDILFNKRQKNLILY